MIKLSWGKSPKALAPKLFIISGGPGLSSMTMRSLDLLSQNFHLAYVDFPGTGENPYKGKKTFEDLSFELTELIRKESGEKYSLGHSFGGFFAADAFVSGAVKGLICLSVPFSLEALDTVSDNYKKFQTPELSRAEQKWSKYKDDASFAGWLSEYGELYFKKSLGKNMILMDKVSADFFKDNRSDALQMESLLRKLSQSQGKKLFISGSDDKLLPVSILKKDADRGKFDYFEVPNASHFVQFDQPSEVVQIINKNILKLNKGDV